MTTRPATCLPGPTEPATSWSWWFSTRPRRARDPRHAAASYHPPRVVRRRNVMPGRTYGRTKSGKLIDDTMIEKLADEAELGYTPQQLLAKPRGRGRPPLGDAAKAVESVRIDPDLREEAAQRAAEEGVTVSEIIRRALRQYLRSA